MGKIVLGYWDCPYCDSKEIEGTIRECPHCGRPRGEDTIFYMKGDVKYLSEEESKTKGKGPDWKCSYCGALNSTTDEMCKSCGASKESSEENYFQMRERKKQENHNRGRSNTDINKQFKQNHISKKGNKGSFFGKFKVPFFIFSIITLCVFFASSLIQKTDTLLCKEYSWEATVSVEKYQEIKDSGWSLPSEARLDHTKKEVYRYDRVQVGTKTETYQSYEAVGSHVEKSYSNNGDGTFTENSRTVTDYGYVTRTRTVPQYKDIPVYKTKYYYWEWRWCHERNATSTGKTREVKYPKVVYKENEREEDKTVKYYIIATNKKGEENKYLCDKENWMKFEKGKETKVKISDNYIKEVIE